jgi:hypothetical protein
VGLASAASAGEIDEMIVTAKRPAAHRLELSEEILAETKAAVQASRAQITAPVVQIEIPALTR